MRTILSPNHEPVLLNTISIYLQKRIPSDNPETGKKHFESHLIYSYPRPISDRQRPILFRFLKKTEQLVNVVCG